MATRADLVGELLKYPAAERAEAARALLTSLDGADDPTELESAWRAEITERVREIENGVVQLEDGPSVMGELEERARARLRDRRR